MSGKKDEEKVVEMISESEWCYIDSYDQVQGPFPLSTMKQWLKDSYFSTDLLVKKVDGETVESCKGNDLKELGYRDINSFDEFRLDVPNKNDFTPLDDHSSHDFVFESSSTFQGESFTGDGALSAQLPPDKPPTRGYDRDERMMSHYFDYNEYQKTMNTNSAVKKQKKKKSSVKGTKKFWKERKEKKRRAKLVAEYLAD